MNSTVYRVELSYTRRELLALFDFAPRPTSNGADATMPAVAPSSCGAMGWQHAAIWDESDVLGAFYVNWLTDWFWQIECAEGFDLEALRVELGTLELGALGHLKHGSPLSGREP